MEVDASEAQSLRKGVHNLPAYHPMLEDDSQSEVHILFCRTIFCEHLQL